MFSETAAEAGLPAQQHQALVAIAGHVGEGHPSISVLAERLLIAPHTAAELVTRMIEAGLLIKRVSARDRRRMDLALTEKARAALDLLTVAHLNELSILEPALAKALGYLGLGD